MRCRKPVDHGDKCAIDLSDYCGFNTPRSTDPAQFCELLSGHGGQHDNEAGRRW